MFETNKSNKKARRNIFAQAAAVARGHEWNGQAAPAPTTAAVMPPPTSRLSSGSIRMRSGSGTSRTTTTSDSGEFDNQPTPARTRHIPPPFASAISPPKSAAALPKNQHSPPPYPSASSVGSNSAFSVPSPTPQAHAALAPAAQIGTDLSPILSRMRERDAEAMEKYKLRARSGSAATTSTDGSAVSSGAKSVEEDIPSLHSLVTVGSVAPRRLLRPSASAAQLRATPHPLVSPNTSASSRQPDTRNRSGTDPDVLQQHAPTSSVSTSSSVKLDPASPATPTQTSAVPRPPLIKASSSQDSSKEYTGPSSDFARFPPPPSETTERSHTPTTLLPRRLPFNLLSSHKHNGDHHHHNPFSHKRNSSSNSVASRIT